MQQNTILDGLTSMSTRFNHAEVSDHFRKLHFECGGTLIVNMKDIFNQKTLSLLSDMESFLSLFQGFTFFEFVRVWKKIRRTRDGKFFRG